MPSAFIRDKPLQALKFAAVIGALTFGVASLIGVLPGDGLTGLLYLAFVPMLLAVVVGAEALFSGHRLVGTDDPVARFRARRVYTAIRGIELIVTVGAPATFYVLIGQIGGEVAGPGAIGLLFIGIALGLFAYASVLLRTLVEYYYHRTRSTSPRTDEPGKYVAE